MNRGKIKMTKATSYIGKEVTMKIDRAIGTKHPKHEIVYEINYGYVPNTISEDGEELDCYLLGVKEPVEEYTGICIAVIHRIDDQDDKLVIVPNGKEYSDCEIREKTFFMEQYFKSIIIRKEERG